MKKILSLFVIMMVMTSCASLKKAICDCQGSSEVPTEGKAHAVIPKAPKVTKPDGKGIVIEAADIELGDKMSKAVDAYVFSNQPDDFTNLCKDSRFDCFVDDKRFPQGKKKIKRKVPAYMSGSKMGLQGEKRLKVKYDFYP